MQKKESPTMKICIAPPTQIAVMFPLFSYDVDTIIWKKRIYLQNKTILIEITSLKKFQDTNGRILFRTCNCSWLLKKFTRFASMNREQIFLWNKNLGRYISHIRSAVTIIKLTIFNWASKLKINKVHTFIIVSF